MKREWIKLDDDIQVCITNSNKFHTVNFSNTVQSAQLAARVADPLALSDANLNQLATMTARLDTATAYSKRAKTEVS